MPFLDHELVEFAFRLPDAMRKNKRVLRLAMQGTLPTTILTDRKRGFNLPVRYWVRHFILNGGDAYLRTGRFADAIGIFKKMIAMEPDASAVHCSLGNACAAAGELQQARDAYAKAEEMRGRIA